MDVQISTTRIGVPGQVYVGVQCGCGWSVIVTDPTRHEALYTLRDRAEAELQTHVEVSGSTACQPWMRR
jgi:hypothetical protein